MRCPSCGELDTKVLDSRAIEDGASIRRRRECGRCGRRFTTHERLEQPFFMVIKKDGSREPFDRQKIMRGIAMACIKRSIPSEDIEKLVEEVERDARNAYEREIDSNAIGDLVMDKLQQLDQVAYVRFASVYRQFTDLRRFKQELEKLL